MISYSPHQCELWFGAPGVLVNLAPAVDGQFSLTGNVSLFRRGVLGQVGRTTDPVDAGYAAAVSCVLTDQVELLETTRLGTFLLRRNDAKFAYLVPALISDYPTSAPAQGAVTVALPISQLAEGLPAGVDFGSSANKRLVALSGTTAKSVANVTASDVLFIMKTSTDTGAGTGFDVKKSGSTLSGDVGAKGAGIYPVTIAPNTGLTVAGKNSGARGTAFVGKVLVAA